MSQNCYKPSRSHLMVNALSKLPNHIELLEYLIKHVMLTCLPYNMNGYKMCMNIY
jgi:hypothetical protein